MQIGIQTEDMTVKGSWSYITMAQPHMFFVYLLSMLVLGAPNHSGTVHPVSRYRWVRMMGPTSRLSTKTLNDSSNTTPNGHTFSLRTTCNERPNACICSLQES